jgi:Type II secretion system (T2SS), protein M subtype b
MTAPFLKSRTAALAALGLAALLFAVVVIVPIWAAFAAQSDEMQESLRQLGFYRAEIASRPKLEAELAALNTQGASVPGVLPGDSTALAQAALQSQIKTLIEANKGQLRSIQMLPPTQKGGFEVVAAQCDVELPMSALKDLAAAIGAHMPYLFIDDASIGAPQIEPDQANARPPTLDLRWTMHGYRWKRQK